ncbi:MAG: hypothetical protein SNH79_01020 [Rikenellaceae bacterium]
MKKSFCYVYISRALICILLFFAVGCEQAVEQNYDYSYSDLNDVRMSSFSVYPSSGEFGEVSLYLFRDDTLDEIVEGCKVESDGTVNVDVTADPLGRVVLVGGDMSNAVVDAVVGKTTLDEFLSTDIYNGYGGSGASAMYATEVSFNRVANGTASVGLERLFSRVDVDVDTNYGAVVTAIRFKGVAQSFSVDAESGESQNVGDIDLALSSSIINRSAAIHYLYAATYKTAAEVEIDLELSSGATKTLTATLPQTIAANKIYIICVNPSQVEFEVSDWGYSVNDNNNSYPTYPISIDVTKMTDMPQGAYVADDGVSICDIPYYQSVFTVALNSEDPIELYGNERCDVKDVATNVFEVTLKRSMVGADSNDVELYLRRKNLSISYGEKITLYQSANPIAMSGAMMSYMNAQSQFVCDTYIDGDILTLEVPTGWSCSVEGDKNWLRMNSAGAASGVYVVQGGYKPNDTEADGRIQNAVLTVTTDEGVKDVYTLSRCNYGLPVVYIGGQYWSKFNMRGNSTSFEDQIQINDDLAQIDDLLAYVYNGGDGCSWDDYHKIVGDGYKGAQVNALNYNTSSMLFDNYSSVTGSYINDMVNTYSTPNGYQRPTINQYLSLFMTNLMTLTLTDNYAASVYGTSSSPSYRYNVYARTALFGSYAALQIAYESDASTKLFWGGLASQSSATSVDNGVYVYAAAQEGSTYGSSYMMKLGLSGGSFISAYSGQNSDAVYFIRCIKTPVDYIITD